MSDNYTRRLESEKAFYQQCANVHDLPPIFRYWADTHLMPMFKKFGFATPEHFLFKEFERYAESCGDKQIRAISIGAGNCDVETFVAKHLIHSGHKNFKIDCLDINEQMLARGAEYTEANGVSEYINPLLGDFNNWVPLHSYDIVIANQSLHHVVNLEGLFDTVSACLLPKGRFLVSDMIGRNGHQRWPEALLVLQPYWERLPEPYKYNQLSRSHEESYINHDCSTEGFEGIRSQDILPLLVERFNFDLFLPFANIIMVFIDRAFGHNFDSEGAWDRGFIDEVHLRDTEGIKSGELTPTQMLASLSLEQVSTRQIAGLSPEFCIRKP